MESALAVQKLKPTIDAIKRQYGDDKKAIQRETTALYEASGVNPAAGQHCSSTLLSRCVASYKQMVAYFVGALGMPRHAHRPLSKASRPSARYLVCLRLLDNHCLCRHDRVNYSGGRYMRYFLGIAGRP